MREAPLPRAGHGLPFQRADVCCCARVLSRLLPLVWPQRYVWLPECHFLAVGFKMSLLHLFSFFYLYSTMFMNPKHVYQCVCLWALAGLWYALWCGGRVCECTAGVSGSIRAGVCGHRHNIAHAQLRFSNGCALRLSSDSTYDRQSNLEDTWLSLRQAVATTLATWRTSPDRAWCRTSTPAASTLP